MNPNLLKIGKLIGLLAIAVWANYFGPGFLATVFFLGTFVAYFLSKDEPFWFVFFLVISDGFIGFFNNYEAVISAIPGLPAVEVGHFYVVLTLVKVIRKKSTFKPFYNGLLSILLVYLIFLVVQGYVLGVSPELNVQFRIIKHLLPLTLFYTLPRLFDEEKHFRETMTLFIPFAFIALFSQVFTITTGFAPSQMLGLYQNFGFAADLEKGFVYRGFFSTKMVLISFFAALYYIATDTKHFNKILLYAVVAADFMAAFLSATRGWVICFSFVTFFFLVLVLKLSARRIGLITLTSVIVLTSLMSIPVVYKQFSQAFDRILTLEALATGDMTAGGTLQRLNDRAPRVVNKWKESPLTGWGFSDDFFKYGDYHVGNQNILMHSGILGAFLLALFFVYFQLKLFQQRFKLPRSHPWKAALLIFPIFFMGWFIIHSSSGQQFQYYGSLTDGMSQSFYFSLGAILFRDITTLHKKKE